MKYAVLILLFSTCYVGQLSAQVRTLKGRVTSGEDGTAVPGANVVIKGTTTGSSTNADGTYALSVPTDAPTTLVFSFIGFKTQELMVSRSQTTVDMVLPRDALALSEVVVSVLGIKEEADKVGSTSSKVNAAAITRSGEPGLINGLAGKASGVQIARSSGDPGASAFIQIRGQNTITGNNQPLVIIDGIPMNNTTEGGTNGGVVPQSRLNDLNPNDVASVQVLKGASAAALWGSRAANGVILITTKKGTDSDKMSVSFSSSFSTDQINAFHPVQGAFGQGANGVYSPTATNSWGDKIANRSGGADEVNTTGQYFEALDGTKYYHIIRKNSRAVYNQSNYDLVFRTGYTWDNALSLSGGDAKSTYFFSVGDLRQTGIQRGNSTYNRTTVRLNTERKFNKIARIATNINYIHSDANRIQRGNNLAGAMVGLLRNPADFDISDYKGSYYASPTASPELNRQRGYRSYLGAVKNPANNNALWALYEQENTTKVNRFIASAELGLKPVEWFDLTGRVGLDTYTDQKLNAFPVNDISGAGDGQFQEQLTKETELNGDLFGRVTKNFGRNFNLSYVLGANINDRQYYNIGATITGYLVPDAGPSFANASALNKNPVNARSHIRTTRGYTTGTLAAYDAVFLTASLAAESSSTFGEKSKRTFYYPSADIAWQFTKLPIFQNTDLLTFGKLRASYGVVGVQPLPYRTNTRFVSAVYANTPWGDNLNSAQYGSGSYIQNREQGDEYLRPERKTEYEIGTDLRLLSNRLRVGFTYYENKINDMLVGVTLAASTGFAAKYTNAARMQNKGIEADLSFDVLRRGAFKWTANAIFSRNRNKVLSLAGTQSVLLTGIENFMDVRAVEGQPIGVFWSSKYALNDDGTRKLDANGFPTAAPVSGVIGNPNPDWTGSLGSTFSYKKLSLELLFETSQGTDFYAGSRSVMYSFGTHADTGNEVTLTQDLKTYAGKVIPAGSTVRGNIQDFGAGPVLLNEAYYTSLGGGFGSLKEQFIEDGSWTRLRQASLNYHLDSPVFRQKTKLQSVDFAVSGRNLILWTKVKGIDPDTNLTGTFTGRGFDYFNTPNTRSLLFTVKITY